jgi:hypothetical protein
MVANTLEKKLAELKECKEKGSISDSEYTAARAALLQISPPAATTIAVDNELSKQQKELRAMVSKWIGTISQPSISGELWDALCVGTADDQLRVQFAKITSKDLRRREIIALFTAAGKGKSPEALVGNTPTHGLAQRSARDVLLQLVAALCVSQTMERTRGSNAERFRMFGETLDLIADEDTAKNATTLLANIRGSRSAFSQSKRDREEEDTLVRRAHKDPTGETQKGTGGFTKKLSQEELKRNCSDGLCHSCGGKGHMSRDCPSKKKI